MSPGAKLIRRAELAGLRLSVSPSGKLAYAGPREVVARFMPELAANREAVIAELKAANERAMTWWAQPVEGWPKKLTIRNIVRDDASVIDLRTAEPKGNA